MVGTMAVSYTAVGGSVATGRLWGLFFQEVWLETEREREIASSNCGTKRVLLCQICVFDHGRKALDPWFSKWTPLAVGKDLKQLWKIPFWVGHEENTSACSLSTVILNHFNINLMQTQKIQAALRSMLMRVIMTRPLRQTFEMTAILSHLTLTMVLCPGWFAKSLSFWVFLKEITQQSCTSRI